MKKILMLITMLCLGTGAYAAEGTVESLLAGYEQTDSSFNTIAETVISDMFDKAEDVSLDQLLNGVNATYNSVGYISETNPTLVPGTLKIVKLPSGKFSVFYNTESHGKGKTTDADSSGTISMDNLDMELDLKQATGSDGKIYLLLKVNLDYGLTRPQFVTYCILNLKK